MLESEHDSISGRFEVIPVRSCAGSCTRRSPVGSVAGFDEAMFDEAMDDWAGFLTAGKKQSIKKSFPVRRGIS